MLLPPYYIHRGIYEVPSRFKRRGNRLNSLMTSGKVLEEYWDWKHCCSYFLKVSFLPLCAPGTQSVYSFIHAADIEHLLCTCITCFREAVESSEAYNRGRVSGEGTQEFPRQREMCHDNM